MQEVFRKYLDSHQTTPVGDEEFALIISYFTPKKLRRRQYLLQEGDVCRHLSFIAKGAMRQYTVDEKGTEHILRFGIENWWMSDRESFITKQPSRFNIEAVEDCELLQLNHTGYEELSRVSPAYIQLNRILDERGYIAAQKRIHSSISNTAEERYIELLNTHPAFFQRFPQNMIASYLGVSPETLSRIRKVVSNQ
jgi:CRP/FNR family transcriptional regulator, anaerobic regulatory protein